MNNRLQLLASLKYLLEQASESNPLGYADIFRFLCLKGMCPSKNTLTRDIRVIKEAGFDLITVKKGKENKYYIPSEHFDTTEARLIVDAIVSAKFVTHNKTKKLIERVLRLTDKEMELHYVKDVALENRQKHNNCFTYYSIDVIQEALAKDRRINFRYFDLDENKNKVYRHKGKIYEVCPITMINGMDNYYLIGYEPCSNSSREKTFRIDRMADTAISKRKIGCIPFDKNECIQRYRSSVFSMYSGQRIMAEFEFDFKAMNIIYDKYGEDTKVTKLGDNRYYAKLPIEDSPTFWGWMFTLEDHIRIISPVFLIDKYVEKLEKTRTFVECV